MGISRRGGTAVGSLLSIAFVAAMVSSTALAQEDAAANEPAALETKDQASPADNAVPAPNDAATDTAASANDGPASDFASDDTESAPVDQQAWNEQYNQALADKLQAAAELVTILKTLPEGGGGTPAQVAAATALVARVNAATKRLSALNADRPNP